MAKWMKKKSYCHNALMTYCLIPVGWAFQPNAIKERMEK